MQAGNPAINSLGIDVSEFQGLITWSQVKTQKAFAFIRTSYGTTIADAMFHANWLGAQKAGVIVSAYHFAVPNASDPNAQVAFMLDQINRAGGYQGHNLAPALDLEDATTLDDAALRDWAVAFCNSLDAAIKNPAQRTMIYSYVAFIASHPLTFAALRDRLLWIADYNPSGQPPNVASWTQWTAWQYADTGRVGGILTAVDLDEWHGPASTLVPQSPAPVITHETTTLQQQVADLQKTLTAKDQELAALQAAIAKIQADLKGV